MQISRRRIVGTFASHVEVRLRYLGTIIVGMPYLLRRGNEFEFVSYIFEVFFGDGVGGYGRRTGSRRLWCECRRQECGKRLVRTGGKAFYYRQFLRQLQA